MMPVSVIRQLDRLKRFSTKAAGSAYQRAAVWLMPAAGGDIA